MTSLKSQAKLIILAAPSGAGKTTLCRKLLAAFPNETCFSISHTTRQRRVNEIEGRDYFFITPEEFQKKISQDDFAEWASVHDHFYGTTKEFLNRNLSRGVSVILDIDVQGAKSLLKKYPRDCLTIFISPPTLQDLEKRLKARGTESPEAVQKRLTNAQREMTESSWFQYRIVNEDLDRAYAELQDIYLKELGPRKGSARE